MIKLGRRSVTGHAFETRRKQRGLTRPDLVRLLGDVCQGSILAWERYEVQPCPAMARIALDWYYNGA